MTRAQRIAALLVAALCSGCATLSEAQRDRAATIALDTRSQAIDCGPGANCARPSPLQELGNNALAASTPEAPRHYALILDRGPDALLARLDLLRSARHSIDLQTYIFDEDDAAHLVLDELLAAARRGVKVRVLIDQLSALRNVDTLAALAGAHVNFELRVYNPLFRQARITYPQYLLAAACCWKRLNQRMHSKLLLVDGAIGVTGGRNYQDDYYDWDAEYNFRDRDVLIAGPVAGEMAANFEAFWTSRRSVPAERLNDVGRWLLRKGVPAVPHAAYVQQQRAEAMSRDADDAALVHERLVVPAIPVGAVQFIADLPQKHRRSAPRDERAASDSLRGLIESAQREVLLQTPYLVLSKPAQEMFRAMHQRSDAPRVVVSTNSLAATDAFIVYALSHKYKRRYLREFGFNIYEYKPFPADAPIDPATTGAIPLEPGKTVTEDAGIRETPQQQSEHVATRFFGSGANDPVPLRRAGVRVGLHAKSLVIDERVGVVGTHNFDPRADRYNTESAVVIDDPVFAQALAASIRRDIAPQNSWAIARRDKLPVLSGLDYSLGKVSEHLPLFDLWPLRYATSYEFVPGPQCPQPLPQDHPDFRRCYRPVGEFPEVSLSLKGLTTRIFTAFGAGLAPIL
ncbi:phospholipase D family protein [Lysobacter sp. CFH 32150]|uniref:phospholipase D-like domain-containing protein n=1 Tax=Lysobacter sp. CFH 32150 TaxID=2927128 RepID=UPI001FA77129|nr:phospholipase D family protein [Lysobacter sp. CFH 32150]MCI4568083.1 phospholipase D family protein [Lysobacter sp. CFH 32150]